MGGGSVIPRIKEVTNHQKKEVTNHKRLIVLGGQGVERLHTWVVEERCKSTNGDDIHQIIPSLSREMVSSRSKVLPYLGFGRRLISRSNLVLRFEGSLLYFVVLVNVSFRSLHVDFDREWLNFVSRVFFFISYFVIIIGLCMMFDERFRVHACAHFIPNDGTGRNGVGVGVGVW